MIISIPWFVVGFAIGIILYCIAYVLISSYRFSKDIEKHDKWWNDPFTEEFLYDENGEKIGLIRKVVSDLQLTLKHEDTKHISVHPL